LFEQRPEWLASFNIRQEMRQRLWSELVEPSGISQAVLAVIVARVALFALMPVDSGAKRNGFMRSGFGRLCEAL